MATGRSTHLAAATAAVANQYVTSTNMINGAYSLAATTPPTAGARRVTVTHTIVAVGTDTLGTIAVVGVNLNGQTVTDTITPLAGTVATGVLYFKSITSVTGAGWVIAGGNDTITVGCDARVIVSDGSGVLHAVNVNTTAAGAITLKDSVGTIAILKASVAEGQFIYDVTYSDFLEVVLAAASDVTISAYTT